MSGVVETVEVDPTQAVGRLLPEGWRVERTYGYDGGTALFGVNWYGVAGLLKRVPHGETVTVVVERLWYCEGDATGYPYAGICTPDKPIHSEPCGWLPQPADVDAAPLYGLTIQQPYASLIAHGIKTIETRGFQPRVVKPGDDLAIIAGAKRPTPGEDVGDSGWYWEDTAGDPRCLVNWREPWTGSPLPAPLGAVVAVARFVQALLIVECSNGMDPCLTLHDGLRQVGPGQIDGHTMTQHGTRRDDQLPYGDYRPGRYGWLLDNIRRLPEPIPCTGFQGLRALPADVATATRQAVQ